MNREVHVRFWERLGVRFPRATRQKCPKRLRLPAGKSTYEQMGRGRDASCLAPPAVG